ncbi:hypothetical protein GX48_05535 [Paracoccidioides brasiliensis]|nr:hypothetical protein GX48_05535 [Paracoccidioides brasiliensis]
MIRARSPAVFSGNNHILPILSRRRLLFPASLASRTSSLRSLIISQPLHLSYRTNSAQTANSSASPPYPPSFKKSSIFRRLVGFSAIAIFSCVIGITMSPGVANLVQIAGKIRADEEKSYLPPDDVAGEIDEFINTHPLASSLRADPRFSESRPHLKIPDELRAHNLTAGTLSGTNKIAVPPYMWTEAGGKSLVSMLYLGSDVSGHPGLVHGGLLATVLDEALARCCFPALPNGIGVTANLNIDYRSPAPAGSFFVVRAETVKAEGRKAWVEGRIETLPEEGREPVVVAEAKALFVEPRNVSIHIRHIVRSSSSR